MPRCSIGLQKRHGTLNAGSLLPLWMSPHRMAVVCARTLMLRPEVVDAHDLFVFSEDDCNITASHMHDFRSWSRDSVIPADWILGLMQ